MESKTDQMNLIHAMCWKEINTLKYNLDKLIADSERCQKVMNEFISAEGVTNIFGLIIFDRYMSQMFSALNMARKYNIHLEINNLNKTVLNASTNECLANRNIFPCFFNMLEWRLTSFENHCESTHPIERNKMSVDYNEMNKTKNCNGLPSSIILDRSLVKQPALNIATKTENCNELPSFIISDSSLVKQPALNIATKIGDKIEVMVTHVASPISFYGIIQNNFCENKIFSWNNCQIFSFQKQPFLPKLNDIVLSQYSKDDYWYRAKVIDIDIEKQMCQVFYVDFGNTEVVSLSSLAKCTEDQLKDPLRAVLFQLAYLSIKKEKPLEKSNLKSVIENLVVMILDQVLAVEVVDFRPDMLVVSIIDHQFAEIPKMIIAAGVAEEVI